MNLPDAPHPNRPEPDRPTPTPSGEPEWQERFLTLVEKDLRDELSDSDREALEAHLNTSEQCRAYLAEARKEQQTMSSTIEHVQQQCDFARIERAIMNRKARERVMIRISLIMIGSGSIGATLTYLFGAPASMTFGFTMLVIGAAGHWLIEWNQRMKWRALAERSRSGDPTAETQFERSARTQSMVRELSLLIMIIWLPVMGVLGVTHLIAGNWWHGGFFTLFAVISLPVLPLLWKQLFSRRQRAQERAITAGEIAETRFSDHHAQPGRPEKTDPR